MKKKIIFFLIITILLTACNKPTITTVEHTDYENLTLQYELPMPDYKLIPETAVSSTKINYEIQNGMWFPYMDYPALLNGKTADEFRSEISSRFKNVSSIGINTVYVQVRAFGDAYYQSALFPRAYNNDFDPLKIMTEEAHNLNLSIHAWVNPFRTMLSDTLEKLSDSYQIKQWYNTEKGNYIEKVEGRYYLNPAYEDVQNFIISGILEIIDNYDIDGIHIDDYFYPTTDEKFDRTAAKNITIPLEEWRRENINKFLKGVYGAIKSRNSDILFCISPQGNLENNYSNLYADVKKWFDVGFCDYIIPQLYYGFENETCPFEPTLMNWSDLAKNSEVRLSIGVQTYKIGNYDAYAGAGSDEWQKDINIVPKQIQLARSLGMGISIYSYSDTFSKDIEFIREIAYNIIN